MQYNDFGEELPDPTPAAIPVGYGRPPSLQELMRQMIRNELSEAAAAQGEETFEESIDFDVDDDTADFVSPYEIHDMTPEEVADAESNNGSAQGDGREGGAGNPADGESGGGQAAGGGAGGVRGNAPPKSDVRDQSGGAGNPPSGTESGGRNVV